MEAIAQDEFAPPDVLELKELDKPEIQDGEVFVRVRAASPSTKRSIGCRPRLFARVAQFGF